MISILIFLFGLCIGSFIACMYDRVKAGWTLSDTMIKPSRCASCDTALKPWQNIPLVSHLVQRGRCTKCSSPIPWHLPAIELAVALLAVLLYHLCLWVFSAA